GAHEHAELHDVATLDHAGVREHLRRELHALAADSAQQDLPFHGTLAVLVLPPLGRRLIYDREPCERRLVRVPAGTLHALSAPPRRWLAAPISGKLDHR